MTLLRELPTPGFHVCVVIVKVVLKLVINTVYSSGGMRSNHTLPLLSLGLGYQPKHHLPVIIKPPEQEGHLPHGVVTVWYMCMLYGVYYSMVLVQ